MELRFIRQMTVNLYEYYYLQIPDDHPATDGHICDGTAWYVHRHQLRTGAEWLMSIEVAQTVKSIDKIQQVPGGLGPWIGR